MLLFQSLTPEKAKIITKISGTRVQQKIQFLNKKGTFKSTEQCKECGFCGKVQIGLGYTLDISCDRDIGFWRIRAGKTSKECQYFKPINQVEI